MIPRFGVKASAWLACAALSVSLAMPALAADNPFVDVSSNSWAYQAIVQLHDDGLLEGYPDGYFRGNRKLTRYEMAVLTQRVADRLEADLSDASKATKVNADDIALVRRLIDAYGADLASLKQDVAATKIESDDNANQLRRAQIHVEYALRAGIAGEKAQYVNRAGAIVTPATNDSFGNNYPTTQNTTGTAPQSGSVRHGVADQTIRFGISGQINDRLSYETRLENVDSFDGLNSTTTATPTTGVGSGPLTNGTLRLNYADIKYAAPSGVTVTAGRFLAQDSPLGLLWEDYFNGAQVAYTRAKFSGQAGYSFNSAGGSTTTGYPSQTLFAHAGYKAARHVDVGVGFIDDVNAPNNTLAYGNGMEAVVNQSPQASGAINAEIKVTKRLALQGEYSHHFGKNPNTGARYQQPNAFWGKALYGKTQAATNHNYAELGYIVAGVNGLSNHSEVYGLAQDLSEDYQRFGVATLDGYHTIYAGVHHYFSENARVGLFYQRYALNPNVALPSVTNTGNFLNRDQGQGLFLETLLSF